ncbi:MAG: hypothetical protein MUC97_02815 [Bernardetiaceae bacterium]|jgi:hypothetical protein|nr:hypothetical protein [Bernardetiaceae bacterium]
MDGNIRVEGFRLRDQWHFWAVGYSRKLIDTPHQLWLGGGLMLRYIDQQELWFNSQGPNGGAVSLWGANSNGWSYEIEGGFHLDLTYERRLGDRASVGLKGAAFWSPYLGASWINLSAMPFLSVNFR